LGWAAAGAAVVTASARHARVRFIMTKTFPAVIAFPR
jgi:hypothetical protein